LFDSFAQKV